MLKVSLYILAVVFAIDTAACFCIEERKNNNEL